MYLKYAYILYPRLATIGLEKKSYQTPINTFEFYSFATESDGWNLQLFTQILECNFNVPLSYRPYSFQEELHQRKEIVGKVFNYKRITKIKIKICQYMTRLRASKSIGIYFCGLSNKHLYRLLLNSKFKIFPVIQIENGEKVTFRDNNPNLTLRNEITQLNAEDEFSKLVLQTLKFNMPLNMIEYYQEESSRASKCFPYQPGAIIAAGWNANDQLKFWGAMCAERGSKLADIQHGGGYGTHLYSSREYLERQNCDAFISWGWGNGSDVIPAPSILICEKKLQHEKNTYQVKNKETILWVANETPRYLVSIDNSLHQLERAYFDMQYQFATKLEHPILQQVVMRIRPCSRNEALLRYHLPHLKIYTPEDKDSFFDQLSASKIFISDNLQTTFLYALAFNIPTVVFSRDSMRYINDEAQPYFNALMQTGIYHDSPLAAANHLNHIAQDPLIWWQRHDVQKAREDFCYMFSRATPNWLHEWNELLLKFKP